MKKLLLVALLAVFFTPAFADSLSSAVAGSTSTGSTASSGGNAVTGTNTGTNTVIFTSPANTTSAIDQSVSGTQTLRTVPMVYAPPIGVTAPCMVALSGGVSVVGLGISAGGSIEDPGCTLRETARLLHGIGQEGAAARVMCNNKLAAKAMGSAVCPDEDKRSRVSSVSDQSYASRPVVTQVVSDAQKDPIVCARTGTRC